MFFKQVRRNAVKSRKDNGLFFGSLIVSIVAFYTLLSLEAQDVMLFLKAIESDAVNKLMQLIPLIYLISLFFVFFLVYFAYRYQMDKREKEFGLCLMLGMKRSRLFLLLMGETVLNSLLSLLFGLPLALFLTEIISLATVKLVGLGIVGHQISWSWPAVLGTAAGFIVIQMIAMILLSGQICCKEPLALISDDTEKQTHISMNSGRGLFGVGCILLAAAYILGVIAMRTFSFAVTAAVLLCGAGGTFLFYRGIGSFIGKRIHRMNQNKAGLAVFTGRQIQENVIYEYKALAVASLLLLMAVASVSYGIGAASVHGMTDNKTVDFSIQAEAQEVQNTLDAPENQRLIETYYPMYLGSLWEREQEISWEGLIDAVGLQPELGIKANLLENLRDGTIPYVIPLSSYNTMLGSNGEQEVHLEKHEAALYTSMTDMPDIMTILGGALKEGSYVRVGGQERSLLPVLYSDNIVADRAVTIYLALIVTDEDYDSWTDREREPLCWNVLLKHDIIEENGLMQAIGLLQENLSSTDLEYESYLTGLGRNLFFTVGASYLTIYLGVLFMIIANTVIGVKYLMQQRAARHRYLTLLKFGASAEMLCRSVKAQILFYFLLVLILAMLSSVFAVWTMFTSFLKLPPGMPFGKVILLASAAFLVLMIMEWIYIYVVTAASRREIQGLRAVNKEMDDFE